jgi:glucose/mannose transport system permease protein
MIGAEPEASPHHRGEVSDSAMSCGEEINSMSTAATTDSVATSKPTARVSPRAWLQDALPKIVLAPSFVITIIFVYGFIVWTAYLSFTNSKTFPSYALTGARAYQRLWRWTFESDPPSSWYTSITNMAIFGFLYIGICLALGLFLAILLDQKIRGESVLRPIFLYPMALSFIVTGVAWKWFLDPGLGLEQTLHQFGWTSFHFDWIKNKDFVIYTVVIAGVWQASGFVMAMFLAGLRGIDGEIMKAAQIDPTMRSPPTTEIAMPRRPSVARRRIPPATTSRAPRTFIGMATSHAHVPVVTAP